MSKVAMFSHEVAGGTINGRRWAVIQRGYNCSKDFKEKFPDITRPWYCGYVQLLPQDYYQYGYTAEELPAPGGITYVTDVYGPLTCFPEDEKYVGFDTNHPYMEEITQQQATNETIELAKLLENLEGMPI